MNTYPKHTAYSLIELMVVITIVAILSSVAIPSYRGYINKAKVSEITTLMNYYKIQMVDAIASAADLNTSYHNPSPLITKLALKATNANAAYVMQAQVNNTNLLLTHTTERPLLINFIATLENDLLTWTCQYQTGYKIDLGRNCQALELVALTD